MNEWPNMSCSDGTSCLGVMVFVTVQTSGSMPGRRAIASSCDWMLYLLLECQLSSWRDGFIALLEGTLKDCTARRRECRVIFVRASSIDLVQAEESSPASYIRLKPKVTFCAPIAAPAVMAVKPSISRPVRRQLLTQPLLPNWILLAFIVYRSKSI